ncbi:MAG: hypothetical protein P8100_15595, partial [bacterium]
MEFNLLNVFTIVAGFVAFIFAVFLVSIKTGRRLPNLLLAIYLLWFIQDTLAQYTTNFLYPLSPVAGMLVSLTIFLSMPTIYLFVKSFIYRDFRLSIGSLVHLAPYAAMNLLLFPGYYLVIIRGQFDHAYAEVFFNGLMTKFIYLSVYIQACVYFVLIFMELNKYRQLLIENYSNPDMGNHRWLKQFMLLILAMSLIGLVKNILSFSAAEVITSYASAIVALNILLFISWVLMMALRQPGMFTGIDSDIQPVSKLVEERNKMHKGEKGSETGEPLETADPRVELLHQHMESKQPYMDASLSMHDLASQLDMNVRELSLLINHTLHQH